ncbi:nitrate- and nitrite sensing domain-containing protein [Streptomyces jietaisiensis]|uniref:histidine kinase n=5 Tax=Streptomyces TaxID=1883 RepID=F3NFR1_9ACTN|nr:nitrate- and nitrite sensing domain-containing protein [Streptomyces griseoaurantiacus]EGG47613.1 putative sensor-like histidine kinase [Streptomyces griseoaurantiacus M045]
MQGRFKRDGSASAEPEPHGGTGPNAGSSSPQRAQNSAPTAAGPDSSGRPGGNSPAAGRPGGPAAAPGRQGASPAATPPPIKPKADGPTGPGPRIALRNWRISTRLVSLLALPVVAATSLGALRISDSMDEIKQLDNMKLLTDMTQQATELAAALQNERDQSAGPLANGAKANDFNVKGARDKTDQARVSFVDATQAVNDASGEGGLSGVRETVVGLVGELGNLNSIRNSAYQDDRNAAQTVEAYHRLITQLLDLSQDMAQATSNPEMIQRTRALTAFSTAKEYASEQRAIIAAALPTTNDTFGKLTDSDRQYGQSALEGENSEMKSFSDIYAGNATELLQPISDGNVTIKASDNYAVRVLRNTDGMRTQSKRSYKDWIDDDSNKIESMSKIETSLLSEMEQKARELRNESQQEAIISGALILLVLGVSLVGAFIVARSMIRSLRRLQETATKVAQDRLPELVQQLSESDPQDVDTSVESVGVHSRDEIGQVAAAFDHVHREAVRLAAEQALLRGNVNAMFTNLSRRSQGLIQRQLSLISELESREADPDQLSSLFKLDHLATRMRRNGENLLVLAGEEPGRRWTRPVPLVDVLRAAASEVEQYERIELAAVPTTEVAGRVVNDLVHLLAELLENATSFSSPQTKVKVTGHALPDGRVLIEIHDTGIGLSPEDLAAINERLASPPTVDVSVSRRMGLFVVGRLSQRHGIRIQLRPSDSGGTTALVMLPVDVAQGGKKPQGKPGQGGPTGGPAAAAAAAGAAAARRQNGQQGPGNGDSAGGGLLGGAPQRGQVGAGQGPRAALPGAGQGGRPGGPGGARGPQGGGAPSLFEQNAFEPGSSGAPQGRPAPAGAGGGYGQGAPGAPQGLQAAQAFQDSGTPRQGGFDEARQAPGGFEESGRSGQAPRERRPKESGGRRRPLLPGRGGPRAELPGGNQQPRTPSWGDENAQPAPRASLDAPRGHEEPDALTSTSRMPRVEDRQGPGATAEIPQLGAEPSYEGYNDPSHTAGPHAGRPGGQGQYHGQAEYTGQNASADYSAPGAGFPGPDAAGPQNTGSFVRSDVFGGAPQNGRHPNAPRPNGPRQGGPASYPGQDDSGRFPAQRGQDTGQFPGQRHAQDTGQYAAPHQAHDTGQFPAVGRGQGQNRNQGQDTGQYAPQGYAAQDPSSTGQFPVQGYAAQDPSSTGQFERPQVNGGAADFGAPRPPAPQRPVHREPEALPPASSPGDGRTPLYDNLETNWFHGAGRAEEPQQAPPAPAQAPRPAAAPAPAPTPPSTPERRPAEAAWRSSPNDDLVRQAERVRQPASGGVTTSGLPRRVPRANLVPGTAQQQQHQTGPQVSRAPDDVRGRLTNLRRGIAQGRQAGPPGTGQTGSFPSPTHQQER